MTESFESELTQSTRKVFLEGVHDGMPIALGYFVVSFTLGIAARNAGLDPLQGFLASLNRRAAEYAADHGLLAGAGSDAHVPLALGSAYVEMPDFDGPDDFLTKLRMARTVGHHWDEPRPWSARVVPGTTTG